MFVTSMYNEDRRLIGSHRLNEAELMKEDVFNVPTLLETGVLNPELNGSKNG
jgi:hypothetical protein